MKEQPKKEGVDSSRSFSRFYFSKLNIKLFMIAFMFLILAISSFGIVIYYVVIDSLSFQIQSELELAATLTSNHVITYFDEKTELIKLITSRTQLRRDLNNYISAPNQDLYNEIVLKLKDSKGSIEEIQNLCFINMGGIVDACSDNSITGTDFSQERFFSQGKISEGSYFFKNSGNWNIVISGPIYENNQILGVVIVVYGLQELGDIITERAGLGETGEVLIAFNDNNGQTIYPLPRRFENDAVSMNFVGLPMQAALNKESTFFKKTYDYRDVQVIAATKYIDSVKLGLVSKIDYAEAILPVRDRLIILFVRVSLILVLVLTLLFFLISLRIIKPIHELISAAERLKNNDFKVHLNIKTDDELEQLAGTFNTTAEILDNLENERKQIDKAKTEFLSITSHELRSPMTPMRAQLQMVLGDYFGKLNAEQRNALEIVLNNTERLDKIIVDFLEISRIEAARLKFNFVKADLTKMINLVVEEVKSFMPEKKLRIELDVGRLPIIECDPDRVSQVLRNLLTNSIKFSHQNGRVLVSVKHTDGMIQFSVKDEGVGISEKDQKHLFEPFFQVENMYQHKSGGTGLGLAICKGIVESQNGRIWLVSQEGKGTVFNFTVPLKPVHEIKAIKILFSNGQKTDELVKNLFIEYIGPLGEREFEELQKSKGITYESVHQYISDLAKKGILMKENSEEFKSKIAMVFGREEKEVKKLKKKERLTLPQQEVAEFFSKN